MARIIGFHFTKIHVEKLKENTDTAEQLKVSTNIDIPEIEEIKSDILKTKEEIIGVKFLYEIKYNPDFAKIELEGKILMAVESKLAKDVLKQWKKKKIPEDFRIILFNAVLRKASLKALYLEEELNLPLHMPLPSFRKEEE